MGRWCKRYWRSEVENRESSSACELHPMYLNGFWWAYPLVFVWVIGCLLAIRSRQRHPQVSAAVLVSIVCTLLAYFGQQVVFALLLPAQRGNVADATVYLQATA